MLELYQYELSDIWEQELDVNGEYGYALDRYWAVGECKPFVLKVADRYAGFALVNRESKVDQGAHWMDQFFVLKKYRRHGFGTAAAGEVFSAVPGAWEVGQMMSNYVAQAFWRSVIASYTRGNFSEVKLTGGWWEGVVQCFQVQASTSVGETYPSSK